MPYTFDQVLDTAVANFHGNSSYMDPISNEQMGYTAVAAAYDTIATHYGSDPHESKLDNVELALEHIRQYVSENPDRKMLSAYFYEGSQDLGEVLHIVLRRVIESELEARILDLTAIEFLRNEQVNAASSSRAD